MNSKRFEYTNKDIPFLKKDIVLRTVFAALFILVMVWQFASIVMISFDGTLSIMQICSSVLVFLCCLLLTLISFLYIFKDFRIIAAIKMNGKCVSSVQILIRTTRRSFIRLYSILIQFLTLVTSLVLLCSLTYSFLQITYMSTISFYLPFLLMVCVSGFNSIYHIKNEISTQNSVQEYQNA